MEDQKDTETYIMSTADKLLEQMFSGIKQGECYAEKLRKLAKELESHRENFNTAECAGSTSAVVGALSLIGAGVATLSTGGAAAPLIGVVGAVCSGVGVTVSVATKITENIILSKTMEEVQEIEKKSKDIQEEIKQLFNQLKAECYSTDPDEVDQHVMTEIQKAMARKKSRDWQIDFRILKGERVRLPTELIAGILAAFSLQLSGTNLIQFIDGAELMTSIMYKKGAKKLTKQLSRIGLKRALKGGAMLAGGVVVLALELPEAIANWKDLIKKNHVTEASQSLRDTADAILETCQTQREQFNNMKFFCDSENSPG